MTVENPGSVTHSLIITVEKGKEKKKGEKYPGLSALNAIITYPDAGNRITSRRGGFRQLRLGFAQLSRSGGNMRRSPGWPISGSGYQFLELWRRTAKSWPSLYIYQTPHHVRKSVKTN